jgi:hypothetical protein
LICESEGKISGTIVSALGKPCALIGIRLSLQGLRALPGLGKQGCLPSGGEEDSAWDCMVREFRDCFLAPAGSADGGLGKTRGYI